MRIGAAVTIVGLVLGHAAQAASPQVWQGQAFITGFTTAAAETACTNANATSVGDYYLVIYRPIITGSPENGSTNDEGLDFVSSRTDLHYFTSDGVSFAKPGNAYIIYLDSHAGSSQQTKGSPVIPFKLTIAPSPITLGTQTVTISGSLNDFDDVTGCDVTFTAALDLRVD